jgi:hypothetical protein
MNALSRERFNELVTAYRERHAFDRARSAAGVRRSLRRIASVMQSAADCIAEYQKGGVDIVDESSARAAWRHVNTIVNGSDNRPMMAAYETESTLRSWAAAARRAREEVPSKRYMRSAVRLVAVKLVLAREHEGLKFSSTENGPTVAELRAIAKAAGDRSLTKAGAAKVLKSAMRRGLEHRRKAPE